MLMYIFFCMKSRASCKKILTEPSPFQLDLMKVSLDLQLPNLPPIAKILKKVLNKKWAMMKTVPASQLILSTVKFLHLFLNFYSGFRTTWALRWYSNHLLYWSHLTSKLHHIFTFTRPPQCLSCRGHFYYRIIPCQCKVHINIITRMEVVTSQIRKTW